MDAPRSNANVGKPLQDYAVLQPEDHRSTQERFSRCILVRVSSLKKPAVPSFNAACSLQAEDSTTDATFRDCLITCPFDLHVNILQHRGTGGTGFEKRSSRLRMQVKKQLEIHIRAETEHE